MASIVSLQTYLKIEPTRWADKLLAAVAQVVLTNFKHFGEDSKYSSDACARSGTALLVKSVSTGDDIVLHLGIDTLGAFVLSSLPKKQP